MQRQFMSRQVTSSITIVNLSNLFILLKRKQESDLKLWAAIRNPSEAFLVLDAAHHMIRPTSRCKDVSASNSSSMACQCRLNFCVPWYPCGLKFCRGHDQQTGKALSYRCGIKTCKKCLDYVFPARNVQFCPWDDL